MIRLNVEGKVKEITYRNESCVKVLIEDNLGAEILGTITKKDMDLESIVEVGKIFIFAGGVGVYKTYNEGKRFIDNTFYINQMIEVK